MNFGEKITTLRKQKGITQEQLAEQLGVTRQTISKWELNQSTPDLNYISQLSDLFEVTTDYLIKEENLEDKKDINNEHTDNNYANTPQREPVKPSFVVGIIFSVLGVALIIIGIVLGLTEAGWNVGIMGMAGGVLNLVVGMVLMFVKKHPVLTALWIMWIILFLFIGLFVVNMVGGSLFNLNTVGGIVDWILLIFFIILVAASVRARKESKKNK